jgi:cellobiose phosphorylase
MDAHGSVAIQQPGVGMNASVFSHASTWMISAEAMIGRGDKAMEYFKRMCMASKNAIADRHECEPYVICQWVSYPPFHTPGRGRNSWLTGSAAWNYVAVTQHILGIRPTLDGLQIAPTLPSDWKEFSAQRIFRGCLYKIEVKRNSATNQLKLWVDGKAIQGNVIPLPASSVKEISVVAEIG